MELIDTHAHLEDEQLAPDIDAVIAGARDSMLVAIVAVGTTVESSRRTVQLARKYPIIRAAVGIHPDHVSQAVADDWQSIVQLAQEPEVVAIGETGLDRYRDDSPFDLQLDYLDRHVSLARDRQLPLVIHCRDAETDWLGYLTERARRGPLRGVMHAFTGQAATAARCVELGFYISFAGQLTYRNRKFDSLRELARLVPLDRLLVETDSPYLAPEPHRGQRNEPAYVQFTAQRLSQLRGMDIADLCAVTTSNARRLFGLP